MYLRGVGFEATKKLVRQGTQAERKCGDCRQAMWDAGREGIYARRTIRPDLPFREVFCICEVSDKNQLNTAKPDYGSLTPSE